MASPVAHGAAPRRAVVARPRLLDRLQRRFEVRLLTITGGGGSGKTTLLAQAMDAESDHIDIWYPCRASDRSGERLAIGVLVACTTALGTPSADDDVDPIDRLNEVVLAASPRQVCLVLDDVHVLGRSEALERLLERLPANGHMVTSGRATPPFSTARLDAAGQLDEIRQDELLLTDDEVIEFANLRGVDVATLSGAEGWPAFVELATVGTEARSLRYLDEESLAGLAPDRRAALAAFAFVGGGDDEIAVATTGLPLDELVEDLPLVRWSGDEAQLHDLWGDLLANELDDDQRFAAATAAARIARDRSDIDRAIDLARQVDAWDDVVESISAAVRHGVGGGLSAHQLRRWSAILPNEIRSSAVGWLLEGLLERERDQTSAQAIELLDRAARRFERDGDHELELVALTQLGYLLRIGGDPHDVATFSERVERLAEQHPPARPFLAIGRAWTALTTGRPDRQLAALESIGDDDLPPIWRITRRHLMAHALFNLGRADEALTVVPLEMDTLPVPIPGALVTESQCRWYAGHPEQAIANPPRGSSARHGARDRFIAGGWRGLMNAFAGNTAAARQALAEAQAFAGDAPGDLVQAQVVGLGLIIDLADGDEARVATAFDGIIQMLPLGEGVSELLFSNLFAVPYVLVPSSREFWDRTPMHGIHASVRTMTQAFVRAREDGDLGPIRTMAWPEPGIVAAHMPVRWCVELALLGVRANRHEGRRLAAWLAEHWQQPARAALQLDTEHDTLGDAARDVLAHTPTPPTSVPVLKLLGHTEVDLDGATTSDPNWRRERVRALPCWLALNPDGSRDRAAGALWPDLDAPRAAKNLRTTLNYLLSVLEPGRGAGDAPWFVRTDGQRLSLHPSLDVDLWRFRAALDDADAAERAGHPHAALEHLMSAIALWRGDLAADLDHEWLDLERIHVRSRFVRSAARAAELLVAMGRPADAIGAVRPALDADPYHERSYHALADAYRALGDHSAATAILQRADEAVAAAR